MLNYHDLLHVQLSLLQCGAGTMLAVEAHKAGYFSLLISRKIQTAGGVSNVSSHESTNSHIPCVGMERRWRNVRFYYRGIYDVSGKRPFVCPVTTETVYSLL